MWSVCNPVVFAHLQCGLQPRNLDGTNLCSCWCLQRARRFGQREFLLPYARKSLLSVACLVFLLLALADFCLNVAVALAWLLHILVQQGLPLYSVGHSIPAYSCRSCSFVQDVSCRPWGCHRPTLMHLPLGTWTFNTEWNISWNHAENSGTVHLLSSSILLSNTGSGQPHYTHASSQRDPFINTAGHLRTNEYAHPIQGRPCWSKPEQ